MRKKIGPQSPEMAWKSRKIGRQRPQKHDCASIREVFPDGVLQQSAFFASSADVSCFPNHLEAERTRFRPQRRCFVISKPFQQAVPAVLRANAGERSGYPAWWGKEDPADLRKTQHRRRRAVAPPISGSCPPAAGSRSPIAGSRSSSAKTWRRRRRGGGSARRWRAGRRPGCSREC